ncbi:hypothetical protein NQ176_g3114 [Zarea fungicola]|uniref:Uncharacterized protein n=1 Tax=Zarea fungicola TaxID=93591 RepID=A0ACC1NM34_9HYPO|nr:hypothetical protein NQ176_g3114 [Lecanicillium fungicola]
MMEQEKREICDASHDTGTTHNTEKRTPLENVSTPNEDPQSELILHGAQLWLLLGVLYLSVYLLALELTMLSTVIPTLTNEFGTVADISWYESAYVLPLCVLSPVVAKFYGQFRIKHVYLTFMAIFEIGLIVCAIARSSHGFIIGRALNGLGASGQFSGCMLILSCVCDASVRPLSTALAMAMIPVGSMTGPVIAGVVTARIGWRWCFWILLPMGGAVIIIIAIIKIAEQSEKPTFNKGLKKLPSTLDPIGFFLFAGGIIMLLLALTWGGNQYPWFSTLIIGLLCGSLAANLAFCVWVWYKGDAALIPSSSLTQRPVYIGSLVIFLQGGASQAIPFFLPLWFQAVKGDNPIQSAIHLLPSLATSILGLVVFGSLLRKLPYIPLWATTGSLIASIGSGLCSTLSPNTSIGKWVGFQILTSFGRGMALQVPITAVQELLPLKQHAVSLSILNVFLHLGLATSVSACQTIFNVQLPALLHRYAPDVNVTAIVEAGATDARHFVEPAQLPGFLHGYNKAITTVFYFPTAACVVAALVSCAFEWKSIALTDEAKEDNDPASMS